MVVSELSVVLEGAFGETARFVHAGISLLIPVCCARQASSLQGLRVLSKPIERPGDMSTTLCMLESHFVLDVELRVMPQHMCKMHTKACRDLVVQ